MEKSPRAVVSESTKGTTDDINPSRHAKYSTHGQKSLFTHLKLFTHLHNFSSSKVNHEECFVKIGTNIHRVVIPGYLSCNSLALDR